MTAKAKSKRKRGLLHHVHWIDRGWQPAFIGLCLSERAWKRQMKKMGISEPYPRNDGCATRFDGKNGTIIIVTLNNTKDKTPLEVSGLIVHEATHVFDYVCEAMGEGKPSIEFKAYSTQAIFQSLSEKLEEVTK